MKTLAVLAGVVLIVAGLATALVTGLDPVFAGIGFAAVAIGGVLVWKFHSVGTERMEGPTGQRSRQAPMTELQKNRAQMKDRM